MNILIFEYITGGGMIDRSLPPSLVREGDMMLNAIVRDFAALANTHISTLRDHRLSNKTIYINEIIIGPGQICVEKIEQLIEQFDALLIIAPETDLILTSLCARFSNRAVILLNCDEETIKLTGNKYHTYEYLRVHDIPQIPTYASNQIKEIDADQFIIKLADGVGCEDLFLLHSKNDLEGVLTQHASKKFIIQPYIQGTHASLSLMCWHGECLLLSCNEQCLTQRNSGFVLAQCKVNAIEKKKFISFSKKLVQALPGLLGYVGVDILITEKQILLVEINPRLTTSYVGLSAALGINPAELMLDCFIHQRIPSLKCTKNNVITVDVEANRAA